MEKTIGFNYGALYDDLETQANELGYTFGNNKELVEKLRFSVNMIRIHGLLTDSQADKIYLKLHNKIVKMIKPLVETEREN